jgi:hypothetical protein
MENLASHSRSRTNNRTESRNKPHALRVTTKSAAAKTSSTSRAVPKAAAPSAQRINARLDAAAAKRFDEIIKAKGYSVTEAIKAAIDLLHKEVVPEKRRPTPILDSLIGRFKGADPNISTNYKELLAQGWAEKHGITLRRRADPTEGDMKAVHKAA